MIIKLIVSNPSVGILIPIPQYPLYTASLALNKARPVPYFLDESNDWSLDVDGLEPIVSKARSEGTDGEWLARNRGSLCLRDPTETQSLWVQF
jgi:alanine transaminase